MAPLIPYGTHGGFESVKPWFLRQSPTIERPIRCYVGRRGAGKTLAATYDAVMRMRAGEKVYANYEIVDPYDPSLRSQRITSWKQICDVSDDGSGSCLTDCTIVIDEFASWADSRLWSKIPGFVRAYWAQSRKHGTGMIVTAQSWDSVDKRFRDICDQVIICHHCEPMLLPGFLRARWPHFRHQWAYPEDLRQIEANQAPSLEFESWWAPAFTYAAYRTDEFVAVEEWSAQEYVLQEVGS